VVRSITIDGDVVTENELRDMLQLTFHSEQGMVRGQAEYLAKATTDAIFKWWGEDNE
jgi:hypothetical protein